MSTYVKTFLSKLTLPKKRIFKTSLFSFIRKFYNNHSNSINKIGYISTTGSFIYFLTLENKLSRSIKHYIFKPMYNVIDDLVQSKEVKQSGIDLVEELFKKDETINSVVVTLQKGIKDKRFEQAIAEFSKDWVINNLKQKEFLSSTKDNLIKIVNSEEIKKESIIIAINIKNDKIFKKKVGSVMTEVFTKQPVFTPMMNLFQKCGVNAFNSELVKKEGIKMFFNILDNEDFKSYFYYKSIDPFSLVSHDKLHKKLKNENKDTKEDLLSTINKL
jgi:hypothetical protein